MGVGEHLRRERSDNVIGRAGRQVSGHLSLPLHEWPAPPRSHVLAVQVRVRSWISTSPGSKMIFLSVDPLIMEYGWRFICLRRNSGPNLATR